MKEKLIILASTLFLATLLSSCGPSAKELEEHRIADTIRVADSLAVIQAAEQSAADKKENSPAVAGGLKLSTKTPAGKKFIKTAETKFRVGNVRKASDQIEDMTAKYAGYLTYSLLQNNTTNYSRIPISKDSVLISKEITVENKIVLRIPNENLDSMVRELNKLILFLDYREIKMDEITFSLLANQKARERLMQYDTRQKKHIDEKGGKLKDKTSAEETVLDRQNLADQLDVESQSLNDQVNYCTLTLLIYQQPVWYKEVQVQPNTEPLRQRLFPRIKDALNEGWIVVENIFVFFVSIWWFLGFMSLVAIFIMVLLKKKRKN